MRLGAVLPHHGFGNDRAAIKDLALGIEALGFDHLVAYDHVLGAEPGGRRRHLARSATAHGTSSTNRSCCSASSAASPSRSSWWSASSSLPQRQTALVAKQAAEVQALSGGRLRLGLGTGWNFAEYESLGADFERRGAMLDEQVHVLRELWGRPLVSFDGRFHQLDRVGIRPLPERRIPVWFGGYTGAALRRSAAHGDGHLFGHLRPSELDAARTMHELRRRRRPLAGGVRHGGDRRRQPLIPDAVLEAAGRWRDVGGTHLTIRTTDPAADPDLAARSVDEHLDLLERAHRRAARRSDVTTPPDRRQTPSDRSAT